MDQQAVEMLAFNYARRTFGFKRLSQGLSRSASAFSSFTREYLEPVVDDDQSEQYVNIIGIAANNATYLTRNIRAVFQCICQAGLKLKTEKCHFGVRQLEFLGRTFSSEGVSSRTHKIQNFLGNLSFPKSKKGFTAPSADRKHLQKLFSKDGWKAQPFLQTLKSRSIYEHHMRIERNL